MENDYWEATKLFLTTSGTRLEMLRRSIFVSPDALLPEFEPFAHLPSLFSARTNTHKILSRGRLSCPTVSSTAISFSIITNDEDGASERVVLNGGLTAKVTVWRVGSKLDALQLNLSANDGWAYLQTGGAELLSIFEDTDTPSIRECRAMFSKNAHLLQDA